MEFEPELERRISSCRALKSLDRQREKLRRRELALRRREAALRAERAALRNAVRKLEREEKKQLALRAELSELIGALRERELVRRVLRLRYLDGLTFPRIRETLDAEGLYYGDRHIDRVLRVGERAITAAWEEKKEERS